MAGPWAGKGRRQLRLRKACSLYKDYEHAFTGSTQLLLTMRAMKYWQVPHEGQPHQNRFCALIARKSKRCAACMETNQKLAEAVGDEGFKGPETVKCFAGLCDSGVPLRFGDRTIGMLQTGQVALEPPSRERLMDASWKYLRMITELFAVRF